MSDRRKRDYYKDELHRTPKARQRLNQVKKLLGDDDLAEIKVYTKGLTLSPEDDARELKRTDTKDQD